MQVYNSSLASMMSKGMGYPVSGKGGAAFEEDIIIVDSSDEENEETLEISYDEIEYETDEKEEKEELIFQDLVMLKLWARIYLHPEDPVKVDPAIFGRCFFNRPSAFDTDESDMDEEERMHILSDCGMLKKLAEDYYHPEKGIENVDPAVFGRCFFNRPSAFDTDESDMDEEERMHILSDCVMLKKLAVDYHHPEKGIENVDPAVFGRCFFNRPSAFDTDESDMDEEERMHILSDCAMLKKLAVDYYHPEKGIENIDPAVFGRCFFNRLSAFTDAEIIAKPTSASDKNIPTMGKISSKALPTAKTVPVESTGNVVIRSPSAVMLFGLERDCEAF